MQKPDQCIYSLPFKLYCEIDAIETIMNLALAESHHKTTHVPFQHNWPSNRTIGCRFPAIKLITFNLRMFSYRFRFFFFRLVKNDTIRVVTA